MTAAQCAESDADPFFPGASPRIIDLRGRRAGGQRAPVGQKAERLLLKFIEPGDVTVDKVIAKADVIKRGSTR